MYATPPEDLTDLIMKIKTDVPEYRSQSITLKDSKLDVHVTEKLYQDIKSSAPVVRLSIVEKQPAALQNSRLEECKKSM